jgi:hypothetical protein
MSRPNGLQEATALDNFGYYIEPDTNIQRAYLDPCNGIDLKNIKKNRTVVKTITSAQLLALFTTPISIIPAPAAGFSVLINRFVARHGTGTAYSGIASGEDLVLKYTNASGAECSGQMETTGFLDQATAQIRSVLGVAVAPVDAAAVVLHLLSGNITTGDFDLEVLVDYDIIPTDFAG